MDKERVALRYAKALLKATENPERQLQHKVSLELVLQLFQMEKARKVLMSPVMPDSLKEELLIYAVKQHEMDEDLKGFIRTVVLAKRVGELPEIIRCYSHFLDESKGIVQTIIESAEPLNEVFLQKIEKTLAARLQKKIVFVKKVNPSLLGGFIIRYSGKVLDYSMKSYLRKLTQERQ